MPESGAQAHYLSRDPMPGRVTLPASFAPAVAVNCLRFRVTHEANYRYTMPSRQVKTMLRLLPPLARYYQRRIEESVDVAPLPYDMPRYQDTYGNEVVELHHELVRENLTIVIGAEVETRCAYTEEGLPLPTPQPLRDNEVFAPLREFTSRTQPAAGMRAVVQEVERLIPQEENPLGFFVTLCDRVHHEMTFVSGSTAVDTPAAEAWTERRGVCQDYSHITLTLCRIAGIPARYVSGYVPGEGVMHAWVEGLLPLALSDGGERLCWFAYDPTYNQWVNDRYITVAVGRDYADITPTSGSYFGGPNRLTYRNRVEKLEKKIVLI